MTDVEQRRDPDGSPWPPPRPDQAGTPATPEGPEEQGSAAASWLRLAALGAALVALGLWASWWAVAVVLAFIGMIVLHELGHYISAKRAGMKVTQFFIGFGPRIWSIQRGETEYGIKALPLGAYVRIIGMNNLEEVPPEDEDRTYRSKPFWSRFCVGVAGSAMHFALALVLLAVLLAGFGMQRTDTWQINEVSGLANGACPSCEAGLQPGDRIVSIDGQAVPEYEDLVAYVQAHPDQQVTLVVDRDGQTLEMSTTLANRNANPDGPAVGFLGVRPEHPRVRESVPGAMVGSFREFGSIGWQSVVGLGKVFSPSGLQDYVNNLTGSTEPSSGSGTGGSGGSGSSGENRLISPIGAVQLGASMGESGVANFLAFFIAVNIFVGLFNLIPLLPFDGGHISIAMYEAVRSHKGKPYRADVRKMLPVTYAVVAVLLLLFVGNLYLDLVRPVGG